MMDAASSRDELSSTAQADEPEDQIFRKYYVEMDYFLSPEGLLKVLSAVVCIVSAALFLSGAACPRGLAGGAAGAALLAGAASALLCAGVLLGVPLYAPQAFLFIDIIISTVMGVLLLIIAVLSMTVCQLNTAVSYMHGPLAMVNAGMVTASAVLTYVSVMRRWDAARPVREPPRPAPAEHEA